MVFTDSSLYISFIYIMPELKMCFLQASLHKSQCVKKNQND